MLYPVPPEMPHSSDNILTLLGATEDVGAFQSSIPAEVTQGVAFTQTMTGLRRRGIQWVWASHTTKGLFQRWRPQPTSLWAIHRRRGTTIARHRLASPTFISAVYISLRLKSFINRSSTKFWIGRPSASVRAAPRLIIFYFL